MRLEELLPFSLLAIPLAGIIYANYRQHKLYKELVEAIKSRGAIGEYIYHQNDSSNIRS